MLMVKFKVPITANVQIPGNKDMDIDEIINEIKEYENYWNIEEIHDDYLEIKDLEDERESL